MPPSNHSLSVTQSQMPGPVLAAVGYAARVALASYDQMTKPPTENSPQWKGNPPTLKGEDHRDSSLGMVTGRASWKR